MIRCESQAIPRHAGAAYTLDALVSAPAAANHAAYVTIVFMDAAGKGRAVNLYGSADLWEG
jgi:hypothetical protein